MRAEELIACLGLSPHPEGGHFRELFRSETTVTAADGRVRAALTTIYFLLRAGEVSRWHRVASDETWHFYEGEPLELWVADPDGGAPRCLRLGPVGDDARPAAVVPAGCWQAARPLGAYALVGCTVGPGFDFADFSFVDPQSPVAARLPAVDPR